ncbi:MAG: phosphoribosylformylglycinamidine synthase subunit PurL [Bacteroidetes bacterium]|nr:phosphoribosylformylglycinamidine synthase subunit PurL [Bacteroidota bacterium]
MQEAASLETAKKLGLNEQEWAKINQILGREPNFTELSIFSVMWSEHCSYKNSIKWLKTLPREGEHLLAGAGEENAGLVDIGDGLACAFKIESHNHPSAIEPYQGAATGVGGIHRDIFTMGARPIAALNSLRFGDINLEKTKRLVRGVVKGIGDYGNSFGVPTVGGEVYFDPSYNVNPLVNAFSAGIVEVGKTISATAKGIGNPVYIVGSATGKDGIHGATFASDDLGEDAAESLPAVQVGDPFQEKLLLEATLEAIKTGAVVGMQDMGAAGITCSTSEMSEKGNVGMRIDLDKVPTRQDDMLPFEILLSESQERMLVVVEKGREKDIEAVFEKWDLNCAIIGEVTDTKQLEFYHKGEKVADVPAWDLVLGGGAPVYEREYTEPDYFKEIAKYKIEDVAQPNDLVEVANFLMSHPNIASKRWISEQYDSMVQINTTTTNKSSDASVVRIKGKNKALVMTVDCNSYFIHANPEIGAMIAVSEAARNIVCSGGDPSAVTNCLNFGNPYVPQVFYQFAKAVTGMGKACRKFGTPVTGGNVSFYNQSSDQGPVHPTPTIGMVGVMNNLDHHTTLDFKNEGDFIYLLGESHEDISSSQYLLHYHKVLESPTPYFDIDKEFALQETLSGLIKNGLIQSAHDCSEGGLFVALAESAMAGNVGFEIATHIQMRKDAYLFGESQSRVVVTVKPAAINAFESALGKLPYQKLGAVAKHKNMMIDGKSFGSVDAVAERYNNVIGEYMG